MQSPGYKEDADLAASVTAAATLAEADLIKAVQYGHIREVETALQASVSSDSSLSKISCNLQDGDGCSLLHWAAINNRVHVASMLIEHGADINATGGIMQEAPLQWCCRSKGYGFTHMLQLLLTAGAQVHYANVTGQTALHLAVQAGTLNTMLILLESGAQVDSRDCDGNTPLHWVFKHHKTVLGTPQGLDTVRLLLTYGANPTLQNNKGDSAVHLLARLSYTAFDVGVAMNILKFGSGSRFSNSDSSNTSQHKLSSLLAIENSDGNVAYEIAANRKGPLQAVIDDYHLHDMLPGAWVVTVNWAVLIWAFFACLYAFQWHWIGIVSWLILMIVHFYTNQSALTTMNSRPAYGFAWGVIASLAMGFFIFSAPHVSFKWSSTVGVLVSLISYTLFKTSTTSPLKLTRNIPHSVGVKYLVEKVVSHGIRDGLRKDTAIPYNGRNVEDSSYKMGSVSYTSGSASDTSGVPPKVCATCLVDKTLASMHCSKCDACVVGLDHHCPFVNTCVGVGNRRMFILFTLFASLGCFLSSACGTYVQYNGFIQPCVDVPFHPGMPETIVHIQICLLNNVPAFALLVPLGYIVSFWISCLFWSQISMIAAETTTYATIINAKAFPPRTIPDHRDSCDEDDRDNKSNNSPNQKRHERSRAKSQQQLERDAEAASFRGLVQGYSGRFKGLRKSFMNVLNFFRSGHYLVTYEDIGNRSRRSGGNGGSGGDHNV